MTSQKTKTLTGRLHSVRLLNLMIIGLAGCFHTLSAQFVYLVNTSGQSVEYPLSQVQNMKFQKDTLLITLNTGKTYYSAFSAVEYLTFRDSSIATGIAKNVLEGEILKTMPNPASSEIVITYNFNESSEVICQIYDIAGKQVINQNWGRMAAAEQQKTISAMGLRSGVYLLQLQSNTSLISCKIVKQYDC